MHLFLCLVVFLLFPLWAQGSSPGDETLIQHDAGFPVLSGKYRFTYEEVFLPGDESMGLLGGNYLLGRDRGGYLGLGIYGAVTGERGGFFVGGLETGYSHCWQALWCGDVGLYLGGGGGGAAPQGGGLMVRPHIEIRYLPNVVGGQWGLGLSEVRFPNGDIEHRQIYFSFERRFRTLMLPGWYSDEVLRGFNPNTQRFHPVSRTVYIQSMNYFPTTGQHGRSGKVLDDGINVIGIRWREHDSHLWSWDFETSGALGGRVDGLAQVFAGGSMQWCGSNSFKCHTTVMLGSAGGGDVHTGGGILGRALLGAEYDIGKHWAAMLELGQTSAWQAPFNATTINLALGYRYKTLVPGEGEKFNWPSHGFWQRNRVRAGIQSYFAPVEKLRKGASGGEQVDLIALKLDGFVNRGLFITGQALGAFRGEAGGYAVGLLGIGWHQSWLQNYFWEAEISAGAGGGGGIAVGNGTMIQPMVGIGRQLNQQLSLALNLGRVMAPNGDLSAQVVDVSVNYRFSAPHLAQ